MSRQRIIGIIVAVLVVAAAIVVPIVIVTSGGDDDGPYTLTILHNNDGESKLLPSGDSDFPGIARFIATIQDEQEAASQTSDGVITLTSGDNFLASKELNISLTNVDDIFYDAVALSGTYDAMALGNHDFDFGPDVTAKFINAFDPAIPFLSANINVQNESVLRDLEDEGKLAKSVVIKKNGKEIGVIGAITQSLPSISSPRQAVITNVLNAVKREAAQLTDDGVEIIILVSHLQGVNEELDLVADLENVDVVIAGGGDELLRNEGDTCLKEQETALMEAGEGEEPDPPFGTYPIIRQDSTGQDVYVVTAPGGYRCFGRLDITFDKDGIAQSYTGSSIGVSTSATPDQFVLNNVENPLSSLVAFLNEDVIGRSEADLDGRRASVRTVETNLGSLLADSFIWNATERADDYGVDAPHVAVTNGGGIRNDAVIGAGDVTVGDTFDIAPFSNDVVVMEISRQNFKDLMETTLTGLPDPAGGFAQIGGFTLIYDLDQNVREIDRDNDCAISDAGSRVQNITLDDGTPIVSDGQVISGDNVILTITDFLANGGDCYPLGGIEFTRLGLTYQQSLENYIRSGLDGRITASAYPEGGSARITAQ